MTNQSDMVSRTAVIRGASLEVERLRSVLRRCRTILGNMAEENEGAIFDRWPIHHEPLRADARSLLPVIDEILPEESMSEPPKERSDWPSPSFDARDWAEAFCKRNPAVDEETMLGWFANALMRGFDEHASRIGKLDLDVRCERGCALKKVNSALQTIPLVDLARNVAGLDDRVVNYADIKQLRAVLREYRKEARDILNK